MTSLTHGLGPTWIRSETPTVSYFKDLGVTSRRLPKSQTFAFGKDVAYGNSLSNIAILA
jgi:hypothetical protein